MRISSCPTGTRWARLVDPRGPLPNARKYSRSEFVSPWSSTIQVSSAIRRSPSSVKEPLNKYQKWLYSVYTNRLQTETRPLSPFFIAHGAMFAPFGVL